MESTGTATTGVPTATAKLLTPVFISYASEDIERADALRRLIALVAGSKDQVFLARESIPEGADWRNELKAALEGTPLVLVLWTAAASRSEYVKLEYAFALTREALTVTPVVGDETPLPSELEARQAITGIPLLNEVLGLQRRLLKDGVPPRAVSQVVQRRLEGAGIRLDAADRRSLGALFGVRSYLGYAIALAVMLAAGSGAGVYSVYARWQESLDECCRDLAASGARSELKAEPSAKVDNPVSTPDEKTRTAGALVPGGAERDLARCESDLKRAGDFSSRLEQCTRDKRSTVVANGECARELAACRAKHGTPPTLTHDVPAAMGLPVGPLPDFEINTIEKPRLDAGMTLIAFTVRNKGPGTGSCQITATDIANVQSSSVTTKELAAGEVERLEVRWKKWPYTPNAWITIVADPRHVVSEADETNNEGEFRDNG